MNTKDVKTVQMFGPALSGPARLVNRDVPVCDEQAYKAAGYRRGSIPETAEAPEQPKAVAPQAPAEPKAKRERKPKQEAPQAPAE